jgi:hypothetical protein
MVSSEQGKTVKRGISTHTYSLQDSISCLRLQERTLEDKKGKGKVVPVLNQLSTTP